MTNQPRFRMTGHAKMEAERRNISTSLIEQIIDNPEQIVDGYGGRRIYQSRIKMDGKLYLIRIFVELTDPATVVTVYRTSKISKYWSELL